MSDGVGVGYGARATADGIDAVYFVAQENYPVEFLEQGYPVRLLRYGINRDSGGPGKFRGGAGVVREYEVLAEHAVLSMRIDSVVNPPWGVGGGMRGGTGRAVVNPGHAARAGSWRRCRTAPCCGAAISCCWRPAVAVGTAIRSIARPSRCCRTFATASFRLRRRGATTAWRSLAMRWMRRPRVRLRARRPATKAFHRKGYVDAHRLSSLSRSISAARSPTSRCRTARPAVSGAPRRRARRPIRRRRSSPA